MPLIFLAKRKIKKIFQKNYQISIKFLRARTRRRSVGDMNTAASNPPRRRRKSFSVADLDQVGSVKNN